MFSAEVLTHPRCQDDPCFWNKRRRRVHSEQEKSAPRERKHITHSASLDNLFVGQTRSVGGRFENESRHESRCRLLLFVKLWLTVSWKT